MGDSVDGGGFRTGFIHGMGDSVDGGGFRTGFVHGLADSVDGGWKKVTAVHGLADLVDGTEGDSRSGSGMTMLESDMTVFWGGSGIRV